MAGPSGKYPRRLSRLTAGAFPGEPGGQRRLVPRVPGSSTEGDSEAAPGAQGRRERLSTRDGLGSSGDLGETPLRDLSEEGCMDSVHPRRSGALLRPESMRGTQEERRAPGARGPSRGRTAALRGGRERSRRPATACGDRAPPREGAAPPCQPRGWEPGLSEGCLRAQNPPRSPLPAPRSCYGDPSQQPASAPRTLASSLARKTRENAPNPAQLPSPARLVPAFPVSLPPPPPPPPSYLLPPALSQSSTHTPSQTLRGWVHLRAAILNSRLVKPQSAGQPPGNSPALPSPAPGGSRPWLGPSVPEPQLLVRQQKPALHGRRPPRRPSAPPPGRGLSSREGGGHALGSTWTAPELPARVSYHPPPPPLSS
ncbi:formin-like protein 5 [Cervus elaphus]|uniref:formin-like protein 5 n=1 Tax=Cervus elaphus TaxID=9860 RepID=UPI001CC27FA2|nr:formin-like protein 5 [Cervus elaphus]